MENSSRYGNTRTPYLHLRNLYEGQEATVETRHGTSEQLIGSKLGNKCVKAVSCHHVYLTYMHCTSCEMLDRRAQTRIKIARRNINNLRYADDITLMPESEKELKSLLMKVKGESEKPGLKVNLQKMKIMAFAPITLRQIDGEIMETVTDFIFGGSKITVDSECNHELKDACSLKEKL